MIHCEKKEIFRIYLDQGYTLSLTQLYFFLYPETIEIIIKFQKLGAMIMKKVNPVMCVVAGLVCLLSAQLNAAVTWDMPNEYPATSLQGEADVFFGEALKKASGGQIEIAHHFGGALGFKSKDQLDAVADGAVVLANTFVPTLGGVDPIFLLSAIDSRSPRPEFCQ